MFKRSKKESAPQVGPDKEQFSGPTPVGDALEQEIKHTLRWEELTRQANEQESQATIKHPELLEQRWQTASTEAYLAEVAAQSTLRALKGYDKTFWRNAARSPLPTRKRQ